MTVWRRLRAFSRLSHSKAHRWDHGQGYRAGYKYPCYTDRCVRLSRPAKTNRRLWALSIGSGLSLGESRLENPGQPTSVE